MAFLIHPDSYNYYRGLYRIYFLPDPDDSSKTQNMCILCNLARSIESFFPLGPRFQLVAGSHTKILLYRPPLQSSTSKNQLPRGLQPNLFTIDPRCNYQPLKISFRGASQQNSYLQTPAATIQHSKSFHEVLQQKKSPGNTSEGFSNQLLN